MYVNFLLVIVLFCEEEQCKLLLFWGWKVNNGWGVFMMVSREEKYSYQ